MALSNAQLQGLWIQAGGSRETAPLAAAVALAESGGRPEAHNPVPPDDSYGLWQINMLGALGPDRRKQYGIGSNDQLLDPLTNARAAVAVSGGGKSFSPWSVYTSGAYRQHLQGGVTPDMTPIGSAVLKAGAGSGTGSSGGVEQVGFLNDMWDYVSRPGTLLSPFNIMGKGFDALNNASNGGLMAPLTAPFEAIGSAAMMAAKIMNGIILHMFLPATYIRIAISGFGLILIICGLFIFFTGKVPNPINSQNVAMAAKVIK